MDTKVQTPVELMTRDSVPVLTPLTPQADRREREDGRCK